VRYVILAVLVFFNLFLIPTDTALSEKTERFALIITIDGLRPDAISETNAPILIRLIKSGSYTPSAKTVNPPKTLPSHTSIVTGLTPKKHLTFINEWIDSVGYTEFETIFTVARNEGFSTALFAGKDKLNYIAVPGSIDNVRIFEYSPSSVKEISESFTKYIINNQPRLTLIHFPEPDIPGHKHGWMSEEYLVAIKNVDTEIGKIVSALKQEGMYDEIFLIITSDHGGKGDNHKGNDPLVTTIPWLAVGKDIKGNYTIKEQVYLYDTAPTVLKALGLPKIKNIDGEVVNEIFTQQ
jgi:predicted AlkP superfamily pyrophosphatase or phosphodiesterase